MKVRLIPVLNDSFYFDVNGFQFHEGSINTRSPVHVQFSFAYFNSMKVRLIRGGRPPVRAVRTISIP